MDWLIGAMTVLAMVLQRNGCQICKGTRGARGNENIVNGIVMCDYCYAVALQQAKCECTGNPEDMICPQHGSDYYKQQAKGDE